MPKIVIDTAQLRTRCNMRFEKFEGTLWETPEDSPPVYHYRFIDRGAKHLAVAHLDHVSKNPDFAETRLNRRKCIFNGALDDRLGAYILLDLLPKLGISDFDVLLTDGEEHGQSTASIFVPPTDRTYNWIFEFDRRERDVATYDFGSSEWDKVLKSFGWEPVRGSFTDICRLTHLGCMAFNFGTGYVDEHQETCRVYFDDLLSSVANFTKFWKTYHNKHLPYDSTPRPSTISSYSHYTSRKWYTYGTTKTVQSPPPVEDRVVIEEEDVSPASTAIIDYCLECGNLRELDDDLDLCRDCAAGWLANGYLFEKPTYTLTEKEEEDVINDYCGPTRPDTARECGLPKESVSVPLSPS